MFSLKADNIYDVAKPFHQCSRLFGLTSFSVKYEDQSLKASTDIRSVLSILFMIVWSLIFIALFLTIPQDDLNIYKVWISEISQIGINFSTFGLTISTNLAILWTFFARDYFSKLLNLIVLVDENLTKIKHPLNFKLHKKIIWIFVTIIALLAVTFISSSFFVIDPIKISSLVCMNFLTVCTLINVLVILHFTFWIWAIKIRFEKVNFYLEEYLFNITEGIEKLKTSAKYHAMLVDSSDLINQCYGVPVDIFFFTISVFKNNL